MVQKEAVVVRNATKSYIEKKWCGKKKKDVFDGLNMTVSRASIYGLLGASGCGKTTLLSCIVGIRRLDSGEVWVLGGKPDSKGSGIPGPRVGYMPQDISLVGEFSVRDALYYFGRINGLEDSEIEARRDFFVDLLQLPPTNHLVKNMSGGQQRRVSFAAALIHQPELLILDEPTVGLDPILRENIWAYLIKITQTEGTTVLITTHYIDETKDANKIGLLRDGQLLTESSPQQLLDRLQTSSLEEAFLILSQAQDNRTTIVTHVNRARDDSVNALNNSRQSKDEASERPKINGKVSSLKRFRALMAKNSVQFTRYYSGLLFAVLFPILQVSAFFIGVGGEPKGLKIGIVNDEAGNCDYGNNIGNIWYNEVNGIPNCNWANLSCRFLHNYTDTILAQEYYDDVSEAIAATHEGKLTGIMHFSPNFSEALLARLDVVSLDTVNTSEYIANIIASQIGISLDMSDLHTGIIVQQTLADRFFEIFRDILTDCGYPGKFADLPIRFKDPIYGINNYTGYRQFMAPAYILTLTFFLATYVSSTLLITERTEGVWNRSLVQGVKTEEIFLSHFLTQTVIICIHTTMIICLVFPIWGLECQGSFFGVTLFVFLLGLVGLMYGFFISIMCTSHTMAHILASGSFWPLVMLTGAIWPVEGMPQGLRYISYLLPTTLPAVSLRGVIDKNKAIYEWEVFSGLLIILGWILLLMTLSLIGLKSRSKSS